MTDDTELLRRFADEDSEKAFSALVRRNLDLVYATALRHVSDSHRAEDIAQSVFIDLARKAKALRRHPALVSWLYTSTRYAALKAIRAEQRRQAREQEAIKMNEVPDAPLDWQRLQPLLDEVLSELNERDRELILLRYFRGQRFAEVAATVKINEGAARMRVERALEKMNRRLTARGVGSTTAAIGVVLAGQPGIAAPAGLAASIAGAALAGTAGIGANAGALGAFLIMSKTKIVVAAALLIGGLAATGLEIRANRALRAEIATDDSAQLQLENIQLKAALQKQAGADPTVDELMKLRARITVLKARPEGVTDAGLRAPRNLGRATPAAAIETFCWAIDHSDLDLAAQFMTFSDDTPENRETFMAQFSPVVRARYRTPERLCAEAFFGIGYRGPGANPDPAVAIQVVSVDPDHIPDQVKIKLWWRTGSGRESGGGATYLQRVDGWAEKPFPMLKPSLLQAVHDRIDPLSGDFVPAKTSNPNAGT